MPNSQDRFQRDMDSPFVKARIIRSARNYNGPDKSMRGESVECDFAGKFEARISKSETNPKFEIKNKEFKNSCFEFSISYFGFVSDFVLRISLLRTSCLCGHCGRWRLRWRRCCLPVAVPHPPDCARAL